MSKPRFIAFEGIDGSGKSTQVKLLAHKLESLGHKVYTTCEPTSGPIGKLIRDIFNHRYEADHRVIAGLFVADRLEHILNEKNGMLKMLKEGYTVITDRYYFSSYAYHSVHMPMDWVIQANSMSADLLKPDLNIFVDVAPEVSIERLHTGRAEIELYENLENLKSVRAKYLEAFETFKNKEAISIVDGNRPPDEIASDILEKVLAI